METVLVHLGFFPLSEEAASLQEWREEMTSRLIEDGVLPEE